MIHHYFKTALRNLWNTRGYSFLNIFGLAAGIASASLIFLWAEDEGSYDAYFPHKEDIYVVKSKQGGDAVSGMMGPAIKEDIHGVKYTARMDWGRSYLFKADDHVMYQQGHIVDPEFMDIFSLEFVEGHRATAMDTPNNLVITESTAQRLFGGGKALEKVVRVNETETYVVTGVVKDLPGNSSIQFDWLIPFEQFEKDNGWVRDWTNAVIMTYVQLEPTAKTDDVNHMLSDLAKRKSGNEETTAGHWLYPMERWRLYNNFDVDGNEQDGRIKYVRLFSVIAWVVLVIACINFMNMATARSEKRAKEIGMRKVAGASRNLLILQFLAESMILVIISSFVAITFLYLSLGVFNNLIEKNLSIDLSNPGYILFIMGVVIVCGILSGIYPAFYLSSFNPVTTLKGIKQKTAGTSIFRHGLIIMQCAVSVTFIICTIVIYLQIRHVQGREIGYDINQVMMVPLRGDAVKKTNFIKNQLMATGIVESTGLSSGSALQIGVRTNMDWAGKNPDKKIPLFYQWADEGFIPTLGLELLDGRNFRPAMPGDSNSIIINETFAKLIRPDGKVAGETVYWDGDPMTVVGVVNDFVYNNLYGSVQPVFFRAFDLSGGTLNIRTKKQVDLTEAISQIEKIIKTNNPAYPFEYSFLDEQFNDIFKSERLVQKLVGVFGLLSIIISCIGLVGLAAFMAERRRKEFGIRKVLGASTLSIVGMISRDFTLLVTISCLLAFPVAWWFMSDWLNNYEYRATLNGWVFIITAMGALLITLFAVGTQALKAAIANPLNSLRIE